MTVRQAKRLSLEELGPYLLPVPDPPAVLNWRAVFGNDGPVEMEVGFGKGLFLLNEATRRTAVNFVGVEIVRKYQLFAATRVAKRELKNVRLVKADALLFLRDCVATSSVAAVHVYFPDPWWKKRHQKRRLFTPEFVAECERVLSGSGLLCIATDVEEYFKVMSALLADRSGLELLPPPEEKAAEHDLDYLTNFERKFRKQGLPIWRAAYRKQAVPGDSEVTSPD
jgi:tRNA (guanine-N7-)-methyltransferase